MRTRIIIDTRDADDAPDTPFTLNVYRDDDDGTPSTFTHAIGLGGGALVGYYIPDMLRELADNWRDALVIHEGDDEPAPRTGAEWLQSTRDNESEHDE